VSTTVTRLTNPKIVADGVTFEFFGEVTLTVKSIIEEPVPYLARNDCGEILFADYAMPRIVGMDVTLHSVYRNEQGFLMVMKTEDA
jgi:hypothetical protein